MLGLTFGEQVKVVLNRKGMTIKELAEIIEERTGKKMSRQNLTQRLSRDNFQEQDMRMIAGILGCPLHLSILEESPAAGEARLQEPEAEEAGTKSREASVQPAARAQENDEEVRRQESAEDRHVIEGAYTEDGSEKGIHVDGSYTADRHTDGREAWSRDSRESDSGAAARKERKQGWGFHLHRAREKGEEQEVLVEDVLSEDVLVGDVLSDGILDEEEDTEHGDVNPYTGREYKTNSVRVHPERIGYVQVYNRKDHKWTDMTEWAFLGYQERKKVLLGKDYEPPIYLD